MTDEQRIDTDAFCSCPRGRSERLLAMRRLESWSAWKNATEAQIKANAQRLAQAAWATMPERFSGLTLAGLKKLSIANGDWTLRGPAINAIGNWMADGHVVSGRGTRKTSLLLWSNERGVGKSGAIAALFSEWLRRGHGGVWIDFMEFIPLVKSTYNDDSTLSRASLIGTAQTAELLVIDDLGDVVRKTPETDHTRDVLNEIVRHRHSKNMPTMYTTNLAPGALVEQFDVAFVQRVMEMAVAVEMGGKCLRDLG